MPHRARAAASFWCRPGCRRCMLATALAGVAGCLALLPAACRTAASCRRLRRRGAARAAGECRDDRRPLRAARPLPEPHHVAAAADRGRSGRRLAATGRRAGLRSMTRSHASNVFWSGLEAAVSALLSFASAFVVARLVGPAEVGIGAAAVAVHVLLWVTRQRAVRRRSGAAQRRGQTKRSPARSRHRWSSACVAALLQAAMGRRSPWSLGDSRLTAMSVVLALPLPLVGAAGPVQGLLTRERAYRTLAWRTLIGQGLGTLTGVASALAGAGAWALVAQQLVIFRCRRAGAAARAPVRPHRACQPAEAAGDAAHRPAAHRQHTWCSRAATGCSR